MTCDFQQSGILTSVDSDEPEHPPLSLETPYDIQCECGECVSQPSIAESLCCHEVDLVDRQREELDLQCITKHPGFVGNCINQYVVETSFYEFLANYGHVGDDELVHEMYRHVAYRRFIRWIWQLLGKGVKKPIPSCAVSIIREQWPAQEYTGFRYRRA